MDIMLKNVRVAFAAGLVTPQRGEAGNKLRWGCKFIMPPDHPQLPDLKALIEKVVMDKHLTKGKAKLDEYYRKDKVPLFDADKAGKDWDGFAGNWFLSANKAINFEKQGSPDFDVIKEAPPILVGPNSKKLEPGKESMIYSGCYVHAKVSIKCYEQGEGGVNAVVTGVMFAKDGDSFSSSTPAREVDFEGLAIVEDEADPFEM
jgi:hypothetical protein